MEELAENQIKEEHDMMILCMASHGEEKNLLATYDCLTIDTEKDILRFDQSAHNQLYSEKNVSGSSTMNIVPN